MADAAAQISDEDIVAAIHARMAEEASQPLPLPPPAEPWRADFSTWSDRPSGITNEPVGAAAGRFLRRAFTDPGDPVPQAEGFRTRVGPSAPGANLTDAGRFAANVPPMALSAALMLPGLPLAATDWATGRGAQAINWLGRALNADPGLPEGGTNLARFWPTADQAIDTGYGVANLVKQRVAPGSDVWPEYVPRSLAGQVARSAEDMAALPLMSSAVGKVVGATPPAAFGPGAIIPSAVGGAAGELGARAAEAHPELGLTPGEAAFLAGGGGALLGHGVNAAGERLATRYAPGLAPPITNVGVDAERGALARSAAADFGIQIPAGKIATAGHMPADWAHLQDASAPARAATQASRQSFYDAVNREIGLPEGTNLTEPNVAGRLLEVGRQMDGNLAGTTAELSPAIERRLAGIERRAGQVIDPDRQALLDHIQAVRDLAERSPVRGQLTGAQVQDLTGKESRLGQLGGHQNQLLADLARETTDTLHEAVTDPVVVARQRALNRDYRNTHAVYDAIQSGGGQVSPLAFANAVGRRSGVAAVANSAPDIATGRLAGSPPLGSPERMHALAAISRQFFPDLANSQTAPRAAAAARSAAPGAVIGGAIGAMAGEHTGFTLPAIGAGIWNKIAPGPSGRYAASEGLRQRVLEGAGGPYPTPGALSLLRRQVVPPALTSLLVPQLDR